MAVRGAHGAVAFVGSVLMLPLLACAKTSRPTPTPSDAAVEPPFEPPDEAGGSVPGELLRGSKKFVAPSDCKTALLETVSCRGEDRSFQECLYYFRAEGVPRPAACHAFSNVKERAVATDGGASECNEESPAGWGRVACGAYNVPANYTCFACSSERAETSRQLVQAFTAACDRAIVLKGCNVDLIKTTPP